MEDAHELERGYRGIRRYSLVVHLLPSCAFFARRMHYFAVAGEQAFVTFATVAPATAPLLIAAIVNHFAAMACRVEDTPPAAWMVPTPLTTTPNVLIVQGTNIQLAKPTPSTVPAPIRAPFAAVMRPMSSVRSGMWEQAVDDEGLGQGPVKVVCQEREHH